MNALTEVTLYLVGGPMRQDPAGQESMRQDPAGQDPAGSRPVEMHSRSMHALGIDSHRLLYETAEDYLGHPVSAGIMTTDRGKPFFPDLPGLFFSISHSGAYWVCAYAGEPVGIDLQEYRQLPRAGRIAERCFHISEREYLAAGGSFFDVWAAKESYVKYTGEGITDSFSSFATAGGQGLYPMVRKESRAEGTDAALRHEELLPGYSLCVCTGKPCTLTLIRYTSRSDRR